MKMAEKNFPKSAHAEAAKSKRNFLEETPVHGAVCVHGSRSTLERAFYLTCVIVAAVVTLICVVFTIRDLAQRAECTTSSVRENGVREFPAVTICNMNPVRTSQFVLLPPDGGQQQPPSRRKRGACLNHLDSVEGSTRIDNKEQLEETRTIDSNNTWPRLESLLRSFSVTSDRKSPQRNKRQAEPGEEDSEDSRYLTRRDGFYINYYSRLSQRQQRLFGHQLSHMLLKCSFDGQHCSWEHFADFLDPVLGNCYTFKPGRIRKTRHNSFSISRAGLEMELNVEFPEYLQGVPETAGLKVVVGDPDAPVLPGGVDSVIVTPGTDSHLRVTVEEYVRGGDCSDYRSVDNEDLNIYSERKRSSSSREACLASCEQSRVIHRCSCCLYTYPCPRGTRLCTTRDATCLAAETAPDYGANVKDPCKGRCKVECRYKNYLVSRQDGKWPLPFDEGEVRHEINEAYLRSQSVTSTSRPTVAPTTAIPSGPGNEDGQLNELEQGGDGVIPGPPQIGETGQGKEGLTDSQPSETGPILGDGNFEIPSRRRRHAEISIPDKVTQSLNAYQFPKATLHGASDKVHDRLRREAGDYQEGGGADAALSDTVLKLRVQLSSRDLTVRETRDWVTWHRGLAEIGGHMALWAGLSVVAVVHAGHALSRWLWAGYKSRRSVGSRSSKVMAFN